MIGLKKRRRVQLLAVSGAALIVATALVGYGFRDGLEYFRNPTQLIEAMPPATEEFRLGGIVEGGSILGLPNGGVGFRITDGENSVGVQFLGILPDLFAEERGVVARGSFDGRIFQAVEVLAKHDENYMPKEVVDAMKDQGIFRPEAD